MESSYVVVGMLVVFSVIGSTGNGLVIYGFQRANKPASTVFILTLAGIDFFTCLITIPSTIAMELLNFRVESDVFCKSYHFLLSSTIPLSAFVMVAIAVDRYFCICRPFLRVITEYRAKVISFCLLIFALFIGILSCLNFGVQNQILDTNLVPEKVNKSIVSDYLKSHESNRTVIVNADYLKNDHDFLFWLISQKDGVQYFQNDTEMFCLLTKSLFGETYYDTYVMIYSSFYAICGIIVIILYIVIYRFILVRRQKRLKTESVTCCKLQQMNNGEPLEHTEVLYMNNDVVKSKYDAYAKSPSEEHILQSSVTTKKENNCKPETRYHQLRRKEDHLRMCNVKTALMLSVVALVFILAFLPAWLMKHRLIPPQIIVFNMYYIYNVANPFIYAFMNPDFQQKMKVVIGRFKRT